jgi:hypothetical protein
MERSSYFLPEGKFSAGPIFNYFEAKCIRKTPSETLKECVKPPFSGIPGVILALDYSSSSVLQIPIRYN